MGLSTKPPIIGIVGKIRSGKSTVSKFLSDEYGYTNAPNVRVLKSLLSALNLPLRRDLLALTGDTIFEDLGRDVIALARVNQIKKSNAKDGLRFVIDGIRYPEELEVYRSLPGFKLIAIQATDCFRYERVINDVYKVKDGTPSFEEFLGLNNRQSEKYIDELTELADYTIRNNSSTTELIEAVDAIIKCPD